MFRSCRLEEGKRWLKQETTANVGGAHFDLAALYARTDESDFNIERSLYHSVFATRLYEDAGDQKGGERVWRASLARNLDMATVLGVARIVRAIRRLSALAHDARAYGVFPLPLHW